jgi:hypothetical protein
MKRQKLHNEKIRCRITNKVIGLLKQLAPCAFLLGKADMGYEQNARAAPELSRMLCPEQCICSLTDFKKHEEKREIAMVIFPTQQSSLSTFSRCTCMVCQPYPPSPFLKHRSLSY